MPIVASEAQLATLGAGMLVSNAPPQMVFELHAASPPLYRVRAYTTLSWTDDIASPVVITAAERSLVRAQTAAVGLGAGLLWLDANDYRPYPIVVSSTVVPLPLPRTSMVAIAATQPFQEFAWSVVLKASVLVWFAK